MNMSCLFQKKVLMKYFRSFKIVVLIVQRIQRTYEQSFVIFVDC